MFGLQVTVAPTVEPVSLDEAKAQVRIALTNGAYDQDLLALITASRVYCERITGKAFCTQTLKLTRDRFPGCREEGIIRLPRPPLASVTSVKYDDTDGTEQTLSASTYVVSTAYEPGQISLADGEIWPETIEEAGAVRVVYVAGYGSAADVPPMIKQAMKLLISHWFENREGVLTGTISKAIEFSLQDVLACEFSGSLAGTFG